MTGLRSSEARRVLPLYRGAPTLDRLHVGLRWWSCPLDQVADQVPRSGSVLDVGCGHGVLSCLLATQSPDRSVVGVDIDEHKIGIARQAAAALGVPDRRLSFEPMNDGVLAAGSWGSVVVNDVLYLLDEVDRQALVARCASALVPGGVLVIKEMDHKPAWKYKLTVAQETLSTRVLGITAGGQVAIAEPSEIANQLKDLGMEVRTGRADAGYLHPHVLIVARAAG